MLTKKKSKKWRFKLKNTCNILKGQGADALSKNKLSAAYVSISTGAKSARVG